MFADYQEVLFICIVLVTVTLVLPWVQSQYAFRRDARRIIAFIRESKYAFRSTGAIASGTGIEENRVRDICTQERHIVQNKKNPDSWRIL